MNRVTQEHIEEVVDDLGRAITTLEYSAADLYGLSSDFQPFSVRLMQIVDELDNIVRELT